jgi:hypothetical protein
LITQAPRSSEMLTLFDLAIVVIILAAIPLLIKAGR